MQEEFKPRIPKTTAGFMVGTTLFFACLQWLLSWIFLGGLVVIFSYLTFLLWFKVRDVGFLERFGAKKLVAWIICPLLGVVTLGIIPSALITVVLTIQIVWFEDRLIEKGYITREDLRQLESFVLKTGRLHGFDSPEFKRAITQSLSKEIEERYDHKREEIKDKVISRAKGSKYYRRSAALYDYSKQFSPSEVENDKAA